MKSLEHAMLHIPNRYFAGLHSIYVSFDLSVIPSGQAVVSVELHIPARRSGGSMGERARLRSIVFPWTDDTIRLGIIPPWVDIQPVSGAVAAGEFLVDVTALERSWRLPPEWNYGVAIEHPGLLFANETPPYLLVYQEQHDEGE